MASVIERVFHWDDMYNGNRPTRCALVMVVADMTATCRHAKIEKRVFIEDSHNFNYISRKDD